MKLCGNCGKDEHKFEDCPIIDLQFPPNKKEHEKLKEDAKKWNNFIAKFPLVDFRRLEYISMKEVEKDGIISFDENIVIVERLKKRIEIHIKAKKDLEEAKKLYLNIKLSDKQDMFEACQSDMLDELQTILEGKK